MLQYYIFLVLLCFFYNILELICFFIIAGLRLNIRLAVLMEVIPATIIGTDKITNFI